MMRSMSQSSAPSERRDAPGSRTEDGATTGSQSGLVPPCATTEMGQLDHDLAVVLVTRVGQLPQPRDDLVAIGLEVAESWRAVARDDADPAVMVMAMPPFALLGMVEPVALFRHAVVRIGRLVVVDMMRFFNRRCLSW